MCVFFLIEACQRALTAGLNSTITLLDHLMLVQGTKHNMLRAKYSLVSQNSVREKKISADCSNGVHVIQVLRFHLVILHI